MFKVVVLDDKERLGLYGDKVEYNNLYVEELVNLIMVSHKCGKAVVITPMPVEENKQNADTNIDK